MRMGTSKVICSRDPHCNFLSFTMTTAAASQFPRSARTVVPNSRGVRMQRATGDLLLWQS